MDLKFKFSMAGAVHGKIITGWQLKQIIKGGSFKKFHKGIDYVHILVHII